MFKKISKIMVLVMAVALIAGCGRFNFGSKGGDPKAVAEKFWNAAKSGKADDVKDLVTKASFNGMKDKKDAGSAKGEYTLGDAKIDGEKATIPTTMKDQGFTMKMQTVLVKEDGSWKVDVDQTMMSALAGAFESLGSAMGEGMKGMGEGLGKAVGEGTKAIEESAKGMQEGVKGMAEGLGKAMGEGMKGFAEGMKEAQKEVVKAPEAQQPTTAAPVAQPSSTVSKGFSIGAPVMVEWHGKWWPAKVIDAKIDLWKIHYDGYDASWDEWVGPERIKAK